MSWFRNKLTGQIWEVVQADHIDRLNSDPVYEPIAEPETPEEPLNQTRKRK